VDLIVTTAIAAAVTAIILAAIVLFVMFVHPTRYPWLPPPSHPPGASP
jgi:hypothetical protein